MRGQAYECAFSCERSEKLGTNSCSPPVLPRREAITFLLFEFVYSNLTARMQGSKAIPFTSQSYRLSHISCRLPRIGSARLGASASVGSWGSFRLCHCPEWASADSRAVCSARAAKVYPIDLRSRTAHCRTPRWAKGHLGRTSRRFGGAVERSRRRQLSDTSGRRKRLFDGCYASQHPI